MVLHAQADNMFIGISTHLVVTRFVCNVKIISFWCWIYLLIQKNVIISDEVVEITKY